MPFPSEFAQKNQSVVPNFCQLAGLAANRRIVPMPPEVSPPASAALGLPLALLDTPAYCVDLAVMESNLRSMADWMQVRGKHWRPHVKCHKVAEIAQLQVAAGAIGVTCAKVSEAEAFASAGIGDILIAHLVVGEPKIARLVNLRRA